MADWFNNDLSDYIDKKEKIIVDERKNIRICRFSSVLVGLFVSLLFALFITIFSMIISGMTGEKNPDIGYRVIVAVFLFVFGCPLFAWLIYISELSIRYVLTNNGIYEIRGLIFKSFKFVAYNQITDVEMSIGLLERMFGAGSVGVGTSSGNIVGSISGGNGEICSKNELDIVSVDNYKKIREVIIKNRKK